MIGTYEMHNKGFHTNFKNIRELKNVRGSIKKIASSYWLSAVKRPACYGDFGHSYAFLHF